MDTPLGQLAVAVYAPNDPNPDGVPCLEAFIAAGAARAVAGGLVSVPTDTTAPEAATWVRDWQTFADAGTSAVIDGRVIWYAGAGVLLGDYWLLSDATAIVFQRTPVGAIARLSFRQADGWAPTMEWTTTHGTQSPVASRFEVLNKSAVAAYIDSRTWA